MKPGMNEQKRAGKRETEKQGDTPEAYEKHASEEPVHTATSFSKPVFAKNIKRPWSREMFLSAGS